MDNSAKKQISTKNLGISEIFASKVYSHNWIMLSKLKHLLFVERTASVVGYGPKLTFAKTGSISTSMTEITPCVLRNPAFAYVS